MTYRKTAASSAALVIALAMACAQQDPEIIAAPEPDKGWINVTITEKQDATIILNGENTGIAPPAVVEVHPGSYVVTIDPGVEGRTTIPFETLVDVEIGKTVDAAFDIVDGYPRTVIVEDISNDGCGPCVPAEELLLEEASHYPLSRLLTVHNQTKSPTVFDPMHWANEPELQARFDFYGLSGNPAFAIDGILSFTASPPAAVLTDTLTKHLEQPSPIDLEVSCTVENDSVKVDVTVKSVADIMGDPRLIVLSLQKVIEYDELETEFDPPRFIRRTRDFIPGVDDISGQSIEITEGMNETFSLAAPLRANFQNQFADPEDDPAQVACVAIVQDWSTKYILQAASTLE